jgi:mannose-6-phosphate isomerase-like protein (cupin superfamily)
MCLAASPGQPATPQVEVVALPATPRPFFQILGGPPETVSMEAGLVTLAPGKSVGLHDTRNYEEVLVPLSGEGELRTPGQNALPVKQGVVVYSPPATQHDVVNTGSAPLSYIFIVARVK